MENQNQRICKIEAEIDSTDPQNLKLRNVKLSGNCKFEDLVRVVQNA